MMAAARSTQVGPLGSSTSLVLVFVVIWTIPTLRPASSARSATRTSSSVSGWWTALTTTDSRPQPAALPAASAQVEKDGKFVISGNLFEGGGRGTVSAFGTKVAGAERVSGRHRPPTSATA